MPIECSQEMLEGAPASASVVRAVEHVRDTVDRALREEIEYRRAHGFLQVGPLPSSSSST